MHQRCSWALLLCACAPLEHGSRDNAGTGASDDTSDADEGDDGVPERFDVGDPGDGTGNPDGESGCKKVDFVFVIDGSGSMADQQAQLVASFPGFMAAIEDTVMAQDFRVLIVDTDAAAQQDKIYCGGADCCEAACATSPEAWCCPLVDGECKQGASCTPPEHECDVTLGAGKVADHEGQACGFLGEQRFIVDGQPDLAGAFACAALVGTEGDPEELVVEAMLQAIGPASDPGGCNEGFLREDAVLVVTLITDEGDSSSGTAAQWHEALVSHKAGDEAAIVLLALVGDSDLDAGLCEPLDEDAGNWGDGARPAPRYRELAESFTHGSWASVCADDYAAFFATAVSSIDTACDEFVPPG